MTSVLGAASGGYFWNVPAWFAERIAKRQSVDVLLRVLPAVGVNGDWDDVRSVLLEGMVWFCI